MERRPSCSSFQEPSIYGLRHNAQNIHVLWRERHEQVRVHEPEKPQRQAAGGRWRS
uniref:Uncharacterized protein n=1 Tax=Aegilops tauschii subsp. strangulata TaxID=200361 RepID=A0A453L5B6_AEGTS